MSEHFPETYGTGIEPAQEAPQQEEMPAWMLANLQQQWAINTFHHGVNFHDADNPGQGYQQVSAQLRALNQPHPQARPTYMAVYDGQGVRTERINYPERHDIRGTQE